MGLRLSAAGPARRRRAAGTLGAQPPINHAPRQHRASRSVPPHHRPIVRTWHHRTKIHRHHAWGAMIFGVEIRLDGLYFLSGRHRHRITRVLIVKVKTHGVPPAAVRQHAFFEIGSGMFDHHLETGTRRTVRGSDRSRDVKPVIHFVFGPSRRHRDQRARQCHAHPSAQPVHRSGLSAASNRPLSLNHNVQPCLARCVPRRTAFGGDVCYTSDFWLVNPFFHAVGPGWRGRALALDAPAPRLWFLEIVVGAVLRWPAFSGARTSWRAKKIRGSSSPTDAAARGSTRRRHRRLLPLPPQPERSKRRNPMPPRLVRRIFRASCSHSHRPR